MPDSIHDRDPEKTLIWRGGPVKALGNGKVAGHLVLFGQPSTKDLAGDFFSADTDFGPQETSVVLYQHGLDPNLKARRLCDDATLKADDLGIWIEAQLEMRDAYEKAVYDLAEEGKLGWSSGTAAHLVQREKVAGAYKITVWPLGLDASLTPTPCDPRNHAITLKSLSQSLQEDMTLAALCRLHDELYYCLCDAVWQEDDSLDDRLAELSETFDNCRDAALRVIRSLLTDDDADAKSAHETLLTHVRSRALAARDFDTHSKTVLAAAQEFADRARSLKSLRGSEGRALSTRRRAAFKAVAEALLAAAEQPATAPADPGAVRSLQLTLLAHESDLLALSVGASNL